MACCLPHLPGTGGPGGQLSGLPRPLPAATAPPALPKGGRCWQVSPLHLEFHPQFPSLNFTTTLTGSDSSTIKEIVLWQGGISKQSSPIEAEFVRPEIGPAPEFVRSNLVASVPERRSCCCLLWNATLEGPPILQSQFSKELEELLWTKLALEIGGPVWK